MASATLSLMAAYVRHAPKRFSPSKTTMVRAAAAGFSVLTSCGSSLLPSPSRRRTCGASCCNAIVAPVNGRNSIDVTSKPCRAYMRAESPP
eukprot:scaffold124097_cov105-Phaeocystis_antarctica.AAC.2